MLIPKQDTDKVKDRTTVYFHKDLLSRLKVTAFQLGLKGGVSQLLTIIGVNFLEQRGDFEIRDIVEKGE